MNKQLRGLFAYISGHAAEEQACDFLKQKGYKLIAQNVPGKRGCGVAELDLVMMDKKTLVFVEVKKRANIDEAAEVITTRMQKRLYRGAEVFLSTHPEYALNDCRFDVVLMADGQEPLHLQNVIEEI